MDIKALLKQLAFDLDFMHKNWREEISDGEVIMQGIVPEIYLALNSIVNKN